MVTRIKVSVMFYDRVSATGLGKDTDAGLNTAPARKRSIEMTDKILPHIIAHPIVEYLTHEFSISNRTYRPWGYDCSFLMGIDNIWSGTPVHLT